MSQVNITIDEFIKLLREYDFKKNSIKNLLTNMKYLKKLLQNI